MITLSPVLLEDEFLGVVEVFHDISKETDIDRAKTEFASLASHQLKTPLTAMCWYTEMLMADRAGKISKKAHRYVKKIFANNQRMVALVDALLNVSRIEMGTMAVIPKQIQLIEIIDSVLEELSQQIQGDKLRIEKNYPQQSPTINIDPQLIRIVFQNLLSNAVKYSFEGGIVSISISTPDNDHVFMTISDRGCGIPEDQQSHIFTKLFRAYNAIEKNPDGSGLGLYIVKALIEQSKGRIWFESVENNGTNFYVSLPLA